MLIDASASAYRDAKSLRFACLIGYGLKLSKDIAWPGYCHIGLPFGRSRFGSEMWR